MSPWAKSRPESSWRKYRRSSGPLPTGPAASSIIGTPSSIGAGRVAGERIEAGHQPLDLGLGAPQALIELVDERGRPLEPADQHVHIDLALLEEVHDCVELAARLREAQLLYRDGNLGVRHALPPASFPCTRLRTVPSAKRVTISCSSASAVALRTRAPSAVSVRL